MKQSRLSGWAMMLAAMAGCSPATPRHDKGNASVNIGVGGKSVRLELPPGSGHEVVADVRPADAPSEQGVTLLFYAGNSDAPIATPTLYPPDKPAAFLIRVPPGTRWLRVEAKPLTDGKTSQTVDHGNAPVLGIALRTPE